MRTELLLKFAFEASHSLEGFETPHPHVWKLKVSITGEPIQGRIVDIVSFRKGVEKVIEPIQSKYLNDFEGISPEVRAFPTCETLSRFFYEKLQDLLGTEYLRVNPSLQISSVQVAICEMDGTEMGAARLISDELFKRT